MTADTVGGVWTYSVELAAALAPHGIDVAIASMGGAASEHQRAQVEALPNTRLFESEFKLEWMEDPWDDVDRARAWLLDLESQLHPDLIHLNNYAHGDLAWNAPVLTVGHSCVLSWWEAVHAEPAPSQWSEYAKRVTRGLHASTTVAAPSNAMLSALQRHYGPLKNAVVIPNARTTSRFAPGEKEPFILTAGRLWDKAKNVEGLKRISGELAWPVRTASNLTESELAELMSRASIYAMPALYEPFGLSILEAALSGCALVLGGIPSLRENWTGAALFVDPRDSQDLKDSLTSLMDDFDLRDRFARAARRRAFTFTPERMATRYLECLDGVPVCA